MYAPIHHVGFVATSRRRDGDRNSATFDRIDDMWVNPKGEILVADAGVIRRISPGGRVSTVIDLQIQNLMHRPNRRGPVRLSERTDGTIYAVACTQSSIAIVRDSDHRVRWNEHTVGFHQGGFVVPLPYGMVALPYDNDKIELLDEDCIQVDSTSILISSMTFGARCIYGHEYMGLVFLWKPSRTPQFFMGESIDMETVKAKLESSGNTKFPYPRAITVLNGDIYCLVQRRKAAVIFKNFVAFTGPYNRTGLTGIGSCSANNSLYLAYGTYITRLWTRPEWSTGVHRQFGIKIRHIVKTMITLRARSGTLPHLLPRDILYEVFNWIF